MSLLLVLSLAAANPLPFQTIEDFDDGTVELSSYPGEDMHPDSWVLDSTRTCDSTPYSLKLFGNTWKLESIPPMQLDSGDVWQVAAYVEERGEIQGFGLVDSNHALLYAFAGTQLLNPEIWVTVFQGAFPEDTWNLYRLPVADDWKARYGYLPTVHGIVFINDRDSDPTAVCWFDQVLDITEDLPIRPRVQAWWHRQGTTRNPDGSWDVTISFHSRVIDPDSPEHEYLWHFGDDSTSADTAPIHTYTVLDDHEYTVLLEVVDSTRLWARTTCQVEVDPGPSTFPVRMNFVGDIMLARRYELPGGIIDTLGVEGIFEPTLAWLGEAADITVANLESPLTNQGTRHPTKSVVFKGRPENVAGLSYAGVDLVSLANNHVTDYGAEGMTQTQDTLRAEGILFSGAGQDLYEAYQPVYFNRSGV
ncbi:MAG: CapA family protein, partial [candidate division WOR-3 bacterium]